MPVRYTIIKEKEFLFIEWFIHLGLHMVSRINERPNSFKY
jgi:hypothetical protein